MICGEFERARTGQFGEAAKITITKDGDTYKLSKPYDLYTFKEVKKGVLEDDKGIFGHLTLGSMEFGDGQRGRVLRAEFCYENFYLVAGLDGGKNPAATDESTTPEKKMTPLKVEEAEKLVRDFIFVQNPQMNPEAEFPLKDITPKPVWDRLGAQAFQVTKDVRAHETYIIKDKKVHHIGSGFGGRGVTSMVVAESKGDGRNKLVFAYSWGSGIHRSHVGVFDILAEEPVQVVAPQAYFGRDGDLEVKNGDKQTVEVYAANQKVGRLILEGKEKELKVAIRLSDDVPAEIKKGFKGIE